jgi:hypothetical protein
VDLPDDALMSDQFSTIHGIAAIVCHYAAAGSADRPLGQHIVVDGGASLMNS